MMMPVRALPPTDWEHVVLKSSAYDGLLIKARIPFTQPLYTFYFIFFSQIECTFLPYHPTVCYFVRLIAYFHIFQVEYYFGLFCFQKNAHPL